LVHELALRFWRTAFRHGLSRSRARYVVEHCACPLYPPSIEDDLVAFLCMDAHGVPLEVIGVELADGDLLIIHAIKLRGRFRDDFARVRECQGQ
jgi:hypothetical protein